MLFRPMQIPQSYMELPGPAEPVHHIGIKSLVKEPACCAKTIFERALDICYQVGSRMVAEGAPGTSRTGEPPVAFCCSTP